MRASKTKSRLELKQGYITLHFLKQLNLSTSAFLLLWNSALCYELESSYSSFLINKIYSFSLPPSVLFCLILDLVSVTILNNRSPDPRNSLCRNSWPVLDLCWAMIQPRDKAFQLVHVTLEIQIRFTHFRYNCELYSGLLQQPLSTKWFEHFGHTLQFLVTFSTDVLNW